MLKKIETIVAGCSMIALAPPTPAAAQVNGESRCGADGYVERYSDSSRSWRQSFTHCRNNAANETSGRRTSDEPEDRVTRCGANGVVQRYWRSFHRWEDTFQRCQATDEPDNGRTRCGAGGYVEQYDRYFHIWQNTMMQCR